MKRNFFIMTTLSAVAAASSARTRASAGPATGETDRDAAFAGHEFYVSATPGGCSTYRRRSPFAGYTLADAISKRSF